MPARSQSQMNVYADNATQNGPVGNGQYIAKPKDGIESIAYRHGFFWETVWNDAGNTALREARKDPNVLLPGDKVFIPVKRIRTVDKPPEQTHRFRKKGVPHTLRFQFLKFTGEPYASLKADVAVGGKLLDLTTDADGWLEIPIMPDATEAKVKFANGESYKLDLGRLDPVTEPSGVQQRLRNLGWTELVVTGQLDEQTRDALRRFQASNLLEKTGLPDQTTQDKLVEMNQG